MDKSLVEAYAKVRALSESEEIIHLRALNRELVEALEWLYAVSTDEPEAEELAAQLMASAILAKARKEG